MWNKILILLFPVSILVWKAKGQTPADTVIILPEIQLELDSIEPETASSVPQGNDQLTAPRYYRQIIKPGSISRKGLFTVHKVDDNYYFEIPDSLLGRDLLVVSRIARGAAGVRPGYAGYAGDQVGTTVIRFEKGPSDNIFLRRVSYVDYLGDSTNAMFNAVVRSNLQPLAASFGINAYTPNKEGSVIEVTDYINGDNDVLFFSSGTKQQMKIGSMLSSMCYIKDVRPFPMNVEIRTIKTYNQQSEDGQSFTWELNTSLLLLPKTPMKKRFADRRVGYFTERYIDYGRNPQGVEVVNYIKRWRLEPRAEDLEKYLRGELVEPERPILFYIDPATPRKWVPYLIQGVEDWQVAFTQAGFKNAVVAKEAPTNETEEWSLEDARHSVIVYKPSSIANATGPIITDPRSGEILESHINWYHNLMSLLRTWYMVQCGAVDPRARKMNFDDELMGSLIRSVASHEVGHALGLLHNFGASSALPVEILRNKDYVEKYGFCPSIMDYARFNYVAQPEDSISEKGLISRIGAYDMWAIEWGYRYFPDTLTSDEERRQLGSNITEKTSDNRLWFGSEFATNDPRVQTEDIGNNAMKASEYGIRNLQRIVPNLLEWTKTEGAGYAGLAEIYSAVKSQYSNYLRHVTRYVGGTYQTLKVSNQPGPVYETVPTERKREAMRFLDKHLFQTPYWLLDTAVLSRLGSPPLQVAGRFQADVLSNLLDLNTLNELVFAESMYGQATYTILDFFNDMDEFIWKELANNQRVDQYRRLLQRYYIEKLILLQSSSTTGQGYNDVVPTVIAQLKRLRGRIRASLKKVADPMTVNHLQYIYDKINEALPPDSRN